MSGCELTASCRPSSLRLPLLPSSPLPLSLLSLGVERRLSTAHPGRRLSARRTYAQRRSVITDGAQPKPPDASIRKVKKKGADPQAAPQLCVASYSTNRL